VLRALAAGVADLKTSFQLDAYNPDSKEIITETLPYKEELLHPQVSAGVVVVVSTPPDERPRCDES
jgi:hypothetical protein